MARAKTLVKLEIHKMLAVIAAYLRFLGTDEYGNLADFGRKHKVGQWMLTRIKERKPGDRYEPKMSSIWALIHGMLAYPPSTLTSLNFSELEEDLASGKVEEEMPGLDSDVILILKIVDIVAKKDVLHEGYMKMFLDLVKNLHGQVLEIVKEEAEKTPPRPSKKKRKLKIVKEEDTE